MMTIQQEIYHQNYDKLIGIDLSRQANVGEFLNKLILQ